MSPACERLAQQKKITALSLGQAIQTDHGIWLRHNNEFMHIGTILANGNLQQLTRYTFNNNLELEQVIYATTAKSTDSGWLLEGIKGTSFSQNTTAQISLPQLLLPDLLNREILDVSGVKHLERLSLRHLHKLITQRKMHELNVLNYEIAFWTKIFQPLAILVMVYLAIPFVFGPLRSASVGLRLLVGIILGFAFHVINAIAVQLPVVVNFPVVVALAAAPLIFALAGLICMKKVK